MAILNSFMVFIILALELAILTTQESVESVACERLLSIGTNKGVPYCDAVHAYVKCSIRETGSYKSDLRTDENINTFKDVFETGLAEQGVYCDVDVKWLVKELQEQESQGVTSKTRTSTERTMLTTEKRVGSGACQVLIPIGLSKGLSNCDSVYAYVKCSIRETGAYKSFLHSDENILNFKTVFEAGLAEDGVHCDVDVKRLVKELLEKDGQVVTSATTTSTVQSKEDAEESAGKQACKKQAIISNYKRFPICEVMQEYAKCIIKVTGIYKSYLTTDGRIAAHKRYIQTLLSDDAKHCDINVKQIVLELQDEDRRGVTYTTRKYTEQAMVTTQKSVGSGVTSSTRTSTERAMLTTQKSVSSGVTSSTRTSTGQSKLDTEVSDGKKACDIQGLISKAKGVPTCNIMQEFTKCSIKATGIYKSILTTDEEIQAYKKLIQRGLPEVAKHCDIDVKQSVLELRDEDRRGVTYTTRKYAGQSRLDTEMSDGEKACEEQVFISNAKGVPICNIMQEFTKCSIKVTGMYKSILTTDEEIQAYKKLIQRALPEVAKHCDIDVKQSVLELQDENRRGVIYTTRKYTVPQTDKDKPDSLLRCLPLLTNREDNGKDPCDSVATYVKCSLRTTGLYRDPTGGNFKEFEKLVKTGVAKEGLDCRMDIMLLAIEAQEDEINGVRYPRENSLDLSRACNSSHRDMYTNCEGFKVYTECVLRESRLYKPYVITEDIIEGYNARFEQVRTRLGPDCVIDIQRLVAELQEKHKNGRDYNKKNYKEDNTTVETTAYPETTTNPVTGAPEFNTTEDTGTPNSSRHDFECHQTTMDVFIPVFIAPNSVLILRDPSCHLQNNGTHYVISFSYGQCGTSQTSFANYINIENEITVQMGLDSGDNPIQFASDYTIPLKCSINVNTTVHASFQAVSREQIKEQITRLADFQIHEYRTADYQDEITDYPVMVPMNREIFFELTLANSRSNDSGIKINKCAATPSPDPNGGSQVLLITNGCSRSSAVKVLPRPTPDRFRFSTQAFHFGTSGNINSMVYVHCDVSVCQGSSCNDTCSGTRRRRSARNLHSVSLTSGQHIVTA